MIRGALALLMLAGLPQWVGGCRGLGTRDRGELPECGEGYLPDRDECVPESCGAGRWGNLELDAGTVYVDIEAADGGDGSVVAPLQSIQAGLDLAGNRGGGMVAVAAGTYPETLATTSEHQDVHLAGRCRELVTLDASPMEGQEQTAIYLGPGSSVLISGLTASGSDWAQIGVRESTSHLDDIAVLPSGGWGVVAQEKASVEVVDSLVLGAAGVGIVASNADTRLTLTGTTVREIQPDEYGTPGFGIFVSEGASLDAEDCFVDQGTYAGIAVDGQGSAATLTGTTVQDTTASESDGLGFGMAATRGALLDAMGCSITGSTGAGIAASAPSSENVLAPTNFRRTNSSKMVASARRA